MDIDNKVSKINALIKENTQSVFSGETPDMKILETEISDFLTGMKSLPAAQAKDYINLVSIWSEEVKKLSDKLMETKTSLEAEMGSVPLQGRAATAYAQAKRHSSE